MYISKDFRVSSHGLLELVTAGVSLPRSGYQSTAEGCRAWAGCGFLRENPTAAHHSGVVPQQTHLPPLVF